MSVVSSASYVNVCQKVALLCDVNKVALMMRPDW